MDEEEIGSFFLIFSIHCSKLTTIYGPIEVGGQQAVEAKSLSDVEIGKETGGCGCSRRRDDELFQWRQSSKRRSAERDIVDVQDLKI